jgi:hypothetical protein
MSANLDLKWLLSLARCCCKLFKLKAALCGRLTTNEVSSSNDSLKERTDVLLTILKAAA